LTRNASDSPNFIETSLKARESDKIGNNFGRSDLVSCQQATRTKSERAMRDRIDEQQEQIDRATSASICDAIGERLRRNLAPEVSTLPTRLQQLLDEMQRQDHANAAKATVA
jgi:hypothetical protein